MKFQEIALVKALLIVVSCSFLRNINMCECYHMLRTVNVHAFSDNISCSFKRINYFVAD